MAHCRCGQKTLPAYGICPNAILLDTPTWVLLHGLTFLVQISWGGKTWPVCKYLTCLVMCDFTWWQTWMKPMSMTLEHLENHVLGVCRGVAEVDEPLEHGSWTSNMPHFVCFQVVAEMDQSSKHENGGCPQLLYCLFKLGSTWICYVPSFIGNARVVRNTLAGWRYLQIQDEHPIWITDAYRCFKWCGCGQMLISNVEWSSIIIFTLFVPWKVMVSSSAVVCMHAHRCHAYHISLLGVVGATVFALTVWSVGLWICLPHSYEGLMIHFHLPSHLGDFTFASGLLNQILSSFPTAFDICLGCLFIHIRPSCPAVVEAFVFGLIIWVLPSSLARIEVVSKSRDLNPCFASETCVWTFVMQILPSHLAATGGLQRLVRIVVSASEGSVRCA